MIIRQVRVSHETFIFVSLQIFVIVHYTTTRTCYRENHHNACWKNVSTSDLRFSESVLISGNSPLVYSNPNIPPSTQPVRTLFFFKSIWTWKSVKIEKKNFFLIPFQIFCNLGSILAHQTSNGVYSGCRRIFWHHWVPWGRIHKQDIKVLVFVFQFFWLVAPPTTFLNNSK